MSEFDPLTFGSSFAGDLIGGIVLGNQSAKHASKQADKANDFTQMMYENAVKKRVADLRGAGINPIMAAGMGLGGGTGGGAIGSGPNMASTAGSSAINSAMAAKRLGAEIDNIKEDTKLKAAQEFATKESGKRERQDAILKNLQALNQSLQNQNDAIDTEWNTSAKGRFFNAMGKMFQSGIGHAGAGIASANMISKLRINPKNPDGSDVLRPKRNKDKPMKNHGHSGKKTWKSY